MPARSINLEIFFNNVRKEVFGGRLNQAQVDGTQAIINEANRRDWDWRWAAYVLATVYHETAATMMPISEYGRGDGRPYGKADPETGQTYYGRGYVQLTWKENYQAMSLIVGVDLVSQPDLALREDIARNILFEGMERGSFTGMRLEDFFSTETDWIGARKIVNGVDRAEEIAKVARTFKSAIDAACADSKVEAAPEAISALADLDPTSETPKATNPKPKTSEIFARSGTVWGATLSGIAAASSLLRDIADNSRAIVDSERGVFIIIAFIGIAGAIVVIRQRIKRGHQFGF